MIKSNYHQELCHLIKLTKSTNLVFKTKMYFEQRICIRLNTKIDLNSIWRVFLQILSTLYKPIKVYFGKTNKIIAKWIIDLTLFCLIFFSDFCKIPVAKSQDASWNDFNLNNNIYYFIKWEAGPFT